MIDKIFNTILPLTLCCDSGITFNPWIDFNELAGTSICWEPCCTTVYVLAVEFTTEDDTILDDVEMPVRPEDICA